MEAKIQEVYEACSWDNFNIVSMVANLHCKWEDKSRIDKNKMKIVLVEKRDGRCEKFDEKKAYDVFCRVGFNAHLNEKEAERLADKAMKDLNQFLEAKSKIKSTELFKQKIKILNKYDKEAAFLYETHRDVN